jgi:LAGLIDADG-like domain
MDNVKQKDKWQIWWNTIGKFRDQAIPIRIPKPSVQLAEFMGIMMGDGGISKYQVTITLHSETDKDYGIFVASLVQELFGVMPAIHPRAGCLAINIVVSRRALVRFCVENGLVIGNKIRQRIDIPGWIKERKEYRLACIRGLIDTDGSVFTHRYRVGGKWYSYKKLDFTSLSRPLCDSVHNTLQELGMRPRLARNKSVRLDSKSDMEKYFIIVGSHNPKHLKRYRE